MTSITPDEFQAFWRQIHVPDHDPHAATGPAPFLWQQRLVEQIAASGQWPGTLDVPTGLGKTTALDIAVFTLAMSFADPSMIALPRRIYMVVDRRVVVDQSFEHANRIGAALRAADVDSVVGKVAQVLTPPAVERHDGPNGDTVPLVIGRMRGGTTWAWRWLERPDQPAIIVGTVDQIGSRILFDGYGVGDTIRPIDAALTGSDALVLIDEAHLAEAFLTTITDARRIGTPTQPLPVGSSHLVVMSATAGTSPLPRFSVEASVERANKVAARRLDAAKKLVTVEAPVARVRRVADTGKALAAVARTLGTRHDVVGVIANTVAVARATFDDLRSDPAIDESQAVLMTGRQRPIDRELLWQRWRHRIEAGRDVQGDGPLYVVATQTIEVGADLDFSGLVTESASVDALVQRLGRLNRRGNWETSTAAIVHPALELEDPIYGVARQTTWEWLTALVPPQPVPARSAALSMRDAVDVGPAALSELLEQSSATVTEMRMPTARVPVLFPSVLDRWVKTSPRGLDTPPTGPFLHGLGRDLPSVNVLWRHAPRSPAGAADTRRNLEQSVALLPPSPDEMVEVPVWAVEAWLRTDAGADDISDISTSVTAHPASREDPPDDLPLIGLHEDGQIKSLRFPLRPGLIIVAPTWRGGLDEYGWNPLSSAAVIDIADLAEHRVQMSDGRQRRRQALRVDDATLLPLIGDSAVGELIITVVGEMRRSIEAEEQTTDLAIGLLNDLAGRADELRQVGGYSSALANVIAALVAGSVVLTPTLAAEPGIHLPLFLAHAPRALERWSTDTSNVATSLSGFPVTLEDHQRAVAARADAFARSLGLPDSVRDAVVIAAAHHDLGKLDPRFQQMLNGGSAPPEPLAKSGMDPSKRWMFTRSQQLAGYPTGMRHEIFSARAAAELHDEHSEVDLIVHLIASHHGRARPLEAAVVDPEPGFRYMIDTDGRSVEICTSGSPDWAQPERFRSLNERFGPWGLAMLETIVRLSDIGCSAEGS